MNKYLLLMSLALVCIFNLTATINFENKTGLSDKSLFFMIELPGRKQKKFDFSRIIDLQEIGLPKTIKIGTRRISEMAEIVDPVPQTTYIIKIDEDTTKKTKKLIAFPKPKK